MRALGLGLFALIVLVSWGAASEVTLSVAEVISSPRKYADARIVIAGVMVPEWKLCAEPIGASNGWKDQDGSRACIDIMRSQKKRLHVERERFIGARVKISGFYLHGCLEEVRLADPEIIREDCKDEGLNGWIAPTNIQTSGFVKLKDPDQGQPPVDVTADPEWSSVDQLVKRLVAVVRKRDATGIAELFPANLRGRYRVTLRNRETRDYWLYLSPEMVKLGRNATQASTGYRHYLRSAASAWTDLCFCRADSCEGLWPGNDRNFDDPDSLATPYVCFPTRRVDGQWYLAGY